MNCVSIEDKIKAAMNIRMFGTFVTSRGLRTAEEEIYQYETKDEIQTWKITEWNKYAVNPNTFDIKLLKKKSK